MRKMEIICFSFIMLMLFCNCSLLEHRSGNAAVPGSSDEGENLILNSRIIELNRDTSEQEAEAKLEIILTAIKGQDSNAISALFSVRALEDAENFDECTEQLFDFVQGDIIEWEKLSGPTVYESSNNGVYRKEISSYYSVSTTKEKYYFQLRDFPIDTEDPSNVGLYMLLVVKDEDSLKIYDSDLKIIYDGRQKLSHAGIYLPLL